MDALAKFNRSQKSLHVDGGRSRRSSFSRSSSILDENDADINYTPMFASKDEKLGRLKISLRYAEDNSTLILKIFKAIRLPAMDITGTSDPYVNILLLPDKKHKYVTSTIPKTLNPEWYEEFSFPSTPKCSLQGRTLYLQVFDFDRMSSDELIGEIYVPLKDMDISQSPLTMWNYLQQRQGHAGLLGEISISLTYTPAMSRLTVGILKCRDLISKDVNGLSDPYVKIWMCINGKKVDKRKTKVKEKTLDPIFNESFEFKCSTDDIRQTSLSVSVFDYDLLGGNELLGEFILGANSGPMEEMHWNEMLDKNRRTVTQWHILRNNHE